MGCGDSSPVNRNTSEGASMTPYAAGLMHHVYQKIQGSFSPAIRISSDEFAFQTSNQQVRFRIQTNHSDWITIYPETQQLKLNKGVSIPKKGNIEADAESVAQLLLSQKDFMVNAVASSANPFDVQISKGKTKRMKR